MEASYAYPSAQSWLQSQGLCQLCGSNGYILSGRELKNQIDLIQSKVREVSDLSIQAEASKAVFGKVFSSSDADNHKVLLVNLKKEVELLRQKKRNDIAMLSALELENADSRKLMQQSKSVLLEKQQMVAMKKTIANDLRQRLKELSNVLFVERMKRALALFKMMSIVVAIPSVPKADVKSGKDGRSVSPNPRSQQLSGCSSILSLPLPNNGIFADLPFETTAVALSHIAHLVDALSGVLNIPLMHPIVMVNATECMISPHYNLGACYGLSPVTHINTRDKHESFGWLTPSEVRKGSAGKRKDGIAAAPDTTDNSSDHVVNKSFPQALTLLQANIIGLCLRAGLPPDSIWPPQAMLLNLHELLVLCARCVKRNSAPPSQSILQSPTKVKGSPVDLPTGESAADGKKDPAVPLVYQDDGTNGTTHPVMVALTQRYSVDGISDSRGRGSVSLPSDLPTNEDEDEVVVMREEVVEEEKQTDDVTFVAVSPQRTEELSVATAEHLRAVKKPVIDEYNEDDYGLTVEEEEYDMLDLLMESQMLAEQSVSGAVDTNNENELWP